MLLLSHGVKGGCTCGSVESDDGVCVCVWISRSEEELDNTQFISGHKCMFCTHMDECVDRSS